MGRDAAAGSGRSGPRGVEQAVQVLARACLFAALLAGASVLVPFSATAPRGLAVVLTVLGLGLAAGLRRLGARTPPALVHGVLALASVLVSLCIAASTTPAGTIVTAFGYVWLALYTAFFHTARQMGAHLTLMGAGFAIGLVASHAPSPLQTWVFVAASVGGVAVTLARLVERLRRLAERDALTGLLTRGSFLGAAERMLAHAARRGEPATLVLLDLDDFKLVNDLEGHLRGDQLLSDLGRDWTRVLRRSDLLARYGGDEFVLLVPGDRASAEEVVARMREATAYSRWSVGLAEWEGERLDDWLGRADTELYAAKRRRGPVVRPRLPLGSE